MAQQAAFSADVQSTDGKDSQYHDWTGADLSFAAVLVGGCDNAIAPNPHHAIDCSSHTIANHAVATALDVLQSIVSMAGPAKTTVTIVRDDGMVQSHGDFSVCRCRHFVATLHQCTRIS